MGWVGWVLATRSLSPDINAVFGFLVLGPIGLGGILMLNNYFDREEDRKNPRKSGSPLIQEKIEPSNVLNASISLMIIGIGLSFAISHQLALLLGIAFFLSFLYSVPPLRLKRVGGFDLLLNVAGFGIICPLCGYSLSGDVWNFPFFYLLVSIPGVGSAFILTALADYEADLSSGIKSICVILGKSKSFFLGLIFMISASSIVILDGIFYSFLFEREFIERIWMLILLAVGVYLVFGEQITPKNFWVVASIVAFSIIIPHILFLLYYSGKWV
jgi:chlorophyll synthase